MSTHGSDAEPLARLAEARDWLDAVLASGEPVLRSSGSEGRRLLGEALDSLDALQRSGWWWEDADDATHMDLRRWVDRCIDDGYTMLRLQDLPARVRGRVGEHLLIAGDGRRSAERVVSGSAHAWLLENRPEHLRNPTDDGVEGQLT